MSRTFFTAAVLAFAAAAQAWGQAEVPDFRIRAQFRDTLGESIGNADFRVISRFFQVYYGGVSRNDEYKFNVQLDTPSLANQSIYVKLNDFQLAPLTANAAGYVDQTYKSRFHADDAPDLPLPAGFPHTVNVGDVVNVYNNATNALLYHSVLGEPFDRADLDQDGDVDALDLLHEKSHFGESGVGPGHGDLTGDDVADGADVLVALRNYYVKGGGGHPVGAVPEPAAAVLAIVGLLGVCSRRRGMR